MLAVETVRTVRTCLVGECFHLSWMKFMFFSIRWGGSRIQVRRRRVFAMFLQFKAMIAVQDGTAYQKPNKLRTFCCGGTQLHHNMSCMICIYPPPSNSGYMKVYEDSNSVSLWFLNWSSTKHPSVSGSTLRPATVRRFGKFLKALRPLNVHLLLVWLWTRWPSQNIFGMWAEQIHLPPAASKPRHALRLFYQMVDFDLRQDNVTIGVMWTPLCQIRTRCPATFLRAGRMCKFCQVNKNKHYKIYFCYLLFMGNICT